MTAQRAFGACLAYLVGTAGEPVPGPDDGDPRTAWRAFLAAQNLGLVEVADPGRFAFPGHFVAEVRGTDGRRPVVMFGVPPGIVHDPSGPAPDEPPAIERAWVLVPLDREVVAGLDPYGRAGADTARVEAIVVAPTAEAPPVLVERARADAGRGLAGDRYWEGRGTFSQGVGDGRALTLIEAEVLDALELPDGSRLSAAEARRNVVTRGIRLNPLVGRRFEIGEVLCEGRRLCEPCAHLERLTRPGTLRALVHRGGLRADILRGGDVAVGAPVRVVR